MRYRRIEELRLLNKLTQQEVADVIGCQREVYRRYEKGTRELPFALAVRLANYYGVTLDYLAGRDIV